MLDIKESRRGQRILTEEKLDGIVYILEEISKEIWVRKHSKEMLNLRPCNCSEIYLS